MEDKIDMNWYTQIDMVQKLTLGLHLITKCLGLYIPNNFLYYTILYYNYIYDIPIAII